MDLILLWWALVAFVGYVDCMCSSVPDQKKSNRSRVYTCIDASLQDLQEIPSDAQWIDISVSKLRSIPDNTFSRFGSLRRLQFSNCRIDLIADHAFNGLTSLDSLIFHGTRLNEAKAVWFRHTQNLKELVLDSCELVYVEPDVFLALQKLQLLSLRDNDLDCLWFDGLATLRDLRTVKIDANPWRCECRRKLEDFIRKISTLEEQRKEKTAVILPTRTQCMIELKVHVGPLSSSRPQIVNEGHSLMYESQNFEIVTLDSLDRLPDTVTWIRLAKLTIDRIPKHMFFRFGSALRSLEFRDCQIDDVEHGAFAGLYKLQQLSFVDSRLRRVEESWFTDLVDLQQLILLGNQVQRIEDHAFRQLRNSLRHLDIRNNNLRCLPLDDIANFVKLEKLDATGNPFTCSCRANLENILRQRNVGFNINVGQCSDNDKDIVEEGVTDVVTTMSSGGYVNCTFFTKFTSTVPPMTEAPAIAPYQEGHCYPDISDGSIYTCTALKSLESLNSVQHTVHTIRIINSNLPEVPPRAFVRFGNYLKKLELRNCGIKMIRGQAFMSLRRLEYLSLRDNSLETIVSMNFKDLVMLRDLNLSQNRITSISNDVFDVLQYLTLLDVSNNSLNCIDVEYLADRMAYLKTFKGTGNPWNCDCLMKLAKFVEDRRLHSDMGCRLSSKCVCGDPPESTATPWLPNVVTPNSEGDAKGTCSAHEDTSGVRYICTGGNLPLLWSIPSHVTVIEFREGNIPHLPRGTFSKFHNLRELTIANCTLSSIESGAFDGLDNLKMLTIRGNPLTTIGTSCLVLPSLETLDLRDNSLSHIAGGAFKHLQNLRYLYLEGNNLKCIFTSDLDDMPNLQSVAFSSIFLRWKCRLELEQYLQMKGIKYVKNEETCDGRKIASYMQNRTKSIEGDCEPIDCVASFASTIRYTDALLLSLMLAFISANCRL